jgi:hypothetical protein
MSLKVSLILPSSPVERVFAALASPFLVLLGLACFVGTRRVFGEGGPDWRSRMFDFFFARALEDLSLSIMFFGFLVFLWAVFRSQTAQRVLLFCATNVWHALIVFGGGFVICCAVAYAAGS